MKKQKKIVFTILAGVCTTGVLLGIAVSLFDQYNAVGFQIWTTSTVVLICVLSVRVLASSSNRTVLSHTIKRAVKSFSFVVGAILLVAAVTVIPLVDQAITNAAFDSAEQEIEFRQINDTHEQAEIISKHLSECSSLDFLYFIVPVVGLVLICYSSVKSYDLVIKGEIEANQRNNTDLSQALADFTSGKNDDLPNSKK